MLFFKELVDEKMSDPDFKHVYDEECHICAKTIKIVAALESDSEKLNSVQKSIRMSRDQWHHFKDADFCDPDQVYAIYKCLGKNADQIMADCPRRR